MVHQHKQETLDNPNRPPNLFGRVYATMLGRSATHGLDPTRAGDTVSPPDQELVHTFETQGYVRQAPLLKDMVDDDSRTTTFTYNPVTGMTRKTDYEGETRELTEHEGIQGLYDFLDATVEQGTDAGPADDAYHNARTARVFRDELAFIGEPEIEEATRGLAAIWKHYLDTDPKRQLCVPVGQTRMGEAGQKSDQYLFGRILDHFSDEELKQLGPRLTTNPKQLKAAPEDTRIVLFDDWSLSDMQLNSGFAAIHTDVDQKYLPCLEINMLAACAPQLDGDKRLQGRQIPRKAYFRTTTNTDSRLSTDRPRVTGIHSSVDNGFEGDMARIVASRNHTAGPDGQVVMPPLTNIVRAYRWQEPRYASSRRGGLRRLTPK